jgi:hypothetical protein
MTFLIFLIDHHPVMLTTAGGVLISATTIAIGLRYSGDSECRRRREVMRLRRLHRA